MLAGSRPSRRHIAATALSLFLIACHHSTAPSNASNPATETYAASLGVNISQMTKVSDALYTQDLVAGTGAVAATGDSIAVTYTGWLVNGTKFDSNVGVSPFRFRLSQHYVIDGWDIGLVGARVGGTRRLIMGSALGYGSSGSGPIPANSTLVFDVQILARYP